MPPRFHVPPTIETPRFWEALEGELSEATGASVLVEPIERMPLYEQRLDQTLVSEAPSVARRESFPVGALAAAAAIVVLLAGFLAFGPENGSPVTAAQPGVETTTTPTPAISAEQMVVNSFQRFVGVRNGADRNEAQRLVDRYRHAGYDVVVQQLNVADASLNGQVIEIRHAIGTTQTTVAQPRGQVVLVIGRAVSVGLNVSS